MINIVLYTQASGEAVYVNDIPKFQNELFGAFTLADVSSATIESLEASEALVSLHHHGIPIRK